MRRSPLDISREIKLWIAIQCEVWIKVKFWVLRNRPQALTIKTTIMLPMVVGNHIATLPSFEKATPPSNPTDLRPATKSSVIEMEWFSCQAGCKRSIIQACSMTQASWSIRALTTRWRMRKMRGSNPTKSVTCGNSKLRWSSLSKFNNKSVLSFRKRVI